MIASATKPLRFKHEQHAQQRQQIVESRVRVLSTNRRTPHIKTHTLYLRCGSRGSGSTQAPQHEYIMSTTMLW
jgi:hypothetical protein